MGIDTSCETNKRMLEEIDTEAKKIKIDMLQQSANGSIGNSLKNSSSIGFVNASTLVTHFQEISDEELFQLAVDFERQHGI